MFKSHSLEVKFCSVNQKSAYEVVIPWDKMSLNIRFLLYLPSRRNAVYVTLPTSFQSLLPLIL